MARDETPDPDAGGVMSNTPREVVIRDDGTERVFVEWFIGDWPSQFVTIRSTGETGTERVLAADLNELRQLIEVLRGAKACLSDEPAGLIDTTVRDLGDLERVYVETEDGTAALIVEELGEIDRVLVLDDDELGKLIATVEVAESELPNVNVGPYVDSPAEDR